MIPSTQTPWTELLSRRFSNVKAEYGPHSQAVASAFAVLDKIEWLEHVGEPWLERVDHATTETGITIVRAWDEALTIFSKDSRYKNAMPTQLTIRGTRSVENGGWAYWPRAIHARKMPPVA